MFYLFLLVLNILSVDIIFLDKKDISKDYESHNFDIYIQANGIFIIQFENDNKTLKTLKLMWIDNNNLKLSILEISRVY